jgi:hypothetical protein
MWDGANSVVICGRVRRPLEADDLELSLLGGLWEGALLGHTQQQKVEAHSAAHSSMANNPRDECCHTRGVPDWGHTAIAEPPECLRQEGSPLPPGRSAACEGHTQLARQHVRWLTGH